MNSMLAIGLMSGTSMDGVDAALIETDGDDVARPIAFVTQPYSEADRVMLRSAMTRALSMEAPGNHPDIISAAAIIDTRHIEAVRTLLARAGRSTGDIKVIGYHGQTIAHRPEKGWTWQIGNGQILADGLGMTVVDDFRSADVAHGGQGAPLVPIYHAALLGRDRGPAVVLNLGGVGNITYVGVNGGLLAFDTGPGNALIDDWMMAKMGLAHDEDGATAAQGKVRQDVLEAMMTHPWFAVPPPKSLDRHDFSLDPVKDLSLEDGAATLTAFTAEAVKKAIALCPARPQAIHVAGGGRHNRTMMNAIAARTNIPAGPVEDLGWNGDATEAEAFAYLAVRCLGGKPNSFPETTGVNTPVGGGRVSMPGSTMMRGARS